MRASNEKIRENGRREEKKDASRRDSKLTAWTSLLEGTLSGQAPVKSGDFMALYGGRGKAKNQRNACHL